jgi:1-acyl-sn-glycerol-3-phosphate acyltransferase
MRAILSPIYKFWYRPKVYGKENILKEGSIVLAGNHIHIMDQCNVIISTKRKLHYMAKKEYFDDKKVAWFFRLVGCIPVDRKRKDANAKEAAIQVLSNGHALGIFPEGTRNGLKKEKAREIYDKYFFEMSFKKFYKKIKKNKTSFVLYLEELKDKGIISELDYLNHLFDVDSYLRNLIKGGVITIDDYYDHILLPLKYGAVSLASKTNSYIVPYAISGKYKFRSKNLIVKIGEPFKASMDLEESNKRLDEEIKKLLREINEKSD